MYNSWLAYTCATIKRGLIYSASRADQQINFHYRINFQKYTHQKYRLIELSTDLFNISYVQYRRIERQVVKRAEGNR